MCITLVGRVGLNAPLDQPMHILRIHGRVSPERADEGFLMNDGGCRGSKNRFFHITFIIFSHGQAMLPTS